MLVEQAVDALTVAVLLVPAIVAWTGMTVGTARAAMTSVFSVKFTLTCVWINGWSIVSKRSELAWVIRPGPGQSLALFTTWVYSATDYR